MLDILFWVSAFTGGMMFLLLILSLIGGLDFDLDIGGDSDLDNGGGLGILKGILTFISMSAWVIRMLLIAEQSPAVSIGVGVVVGLVTVYLLSTLLRYLISQQEFNSWELSDALDLQAKVYLKIPSQGQGIIHVIVNEGVKELKAITRDTVDIPTGTIVQVIDIENEILVVSAQVA